MRKHFQNISKRMAHKINIVVVIMMLSLLSINSLCAQIIVDTTDATGCNKSDGKATITVNTTATGFSFEYSIDGTNFKTSNTFDKLDAKDYTATVRDKNTQCSFTKDFTIKSPEDLLNVTISGNNGPVSFLVCESAPTLTLNASASGGSGDYDYIGWPGGTKTVSSTGWYPVTAKDNVTGCTDDASVFVVFVPIICSRDPNDIIGPEGYGPGKMIAKSKTHSYMIRFENDPDFATAPAQIVKINHPLDSNVNPFSLRLGDFGFGGLTFTVPPDKTFYSTRLNVLDSLGIVVDVTAGIDATKREAFWIFESKDPATGLPPTNALLGFLPVNDSSAKGEGYVNYTIKAANHTQTGDSIRARASIVFDINAAIETPVIYNTIDAGAPTSTVSSLPPTTDSTSLAIKWTGSDDPGGSGVRDYSLYVSENGRVFSVYQSGITNTATNFTGSPGNTYSFYTIATDNTGNTETAKNAGDQTITITQIGELLVFYHDMDNDSYGNSSDTIHAFSAPAGYVTDSTDCNDNNTSVHPGATEICNGMDDDCDGQVDEGVQSVFYHDGDNDGYGNSSDTIYSCNVQTGYVTDSTDCNDSNANIHPGGTEICNGIDDDCDGQIDEGVQSVFYYDGDNDGYGNASDIIYSCTVPAGYVTDSTDCNDNNANVHPGAIEMCNGIDDDCDGQTDEDGCGSQPPSVSITAPTDSATFIAGGNINLAAAASDSDGTISKVEFYRGATLLSTDIEPPYAFRWQRVPAGNYTLTAKATDNSGLVTTSSPVYISVVANKPPTIAIVSPVNNQIFLKGATIHFLAAAHDSNGTISKVEYYNDTTLLATTSLAPYKFDWKIGKLGNFTFTARATDSHGAATTSTAITVSVVPNRPPVVSFVKPGNGEIFTAPATINLEAEAQDPDGRIIQVSFYNGGTLLTNTEHKIPYTFQWQNVPAGTYVLTAVAKDNWTDETTSAPVTITVTSTPSTIAKSRSSSIDSKTGINGTVSLQLVPNPARNILNIYTTGLRKDKQLTVSIISPLGIVMQTKRSTSSNRLVQLNVSSLVSGTYTIKVVSGDKIFYKQFVKL